MRLSFVVALLVPLGAPAWAQVQDNGNSVIAVPLAPPIVAAPPAPVTPAAPVAPPPPGLVQTPVPPPAAVPAPVPSTPAPETAVPGMGPTPAPSVPGAPAGAAPGTTATTGAPAASPPPDALPVIPNDWVPGTKVTLGVLNEVDGGTSEVSIPVGGQSQIGDLQVSVQACDTRPPTELPDAAIFLTVTQEAGSNAGATLYRGWMLRSEPGATVVGDASETFRVVGCS
ncbi:MAG TPA: DUF2155 domain-containing protein [Acidocella sp.]|jgi:hypothetical protein|uniref:DUF2155 domain-containing protein n=1 Tax=Acidocella sp. TaxID=50710 RepID=UPI002B5E555D|nr:DUF2155 domain-containing protein [Acidocella sp.]HVE23020.1 DUF2155 domain-containing protein [Acidocella sp.]